MLNQVILFGRVANEPIIKELPDGKILGEMTLAVQRPFKNGETGEYQTDFIKVSIWQGYAETAKQYCTKGSVVGVKGHINVYKREIENTNVSIPEIIVDNLFFVNLVDK